MVHRGNVSGRPQWPVPGFGLGQVVEAELEKALPGLELGFHMRQQFFNIRQPQGDAYFGQRRAMWHGGHEDTTRG